MGHGVRFPQLVHILCVELVLQVLNSLDVADGFEDGVLTFVCNARVRGQPLNVKKELRCSARRRAKRQIRRLPDEHRIGRVPLAHEIFCSPAENFLVADGLEQHIAGERRTRIDDGFEREQIRRQTSARIHDPAAVQPPVHGGARARRICPFFFVTQAHDVRMRVQRQRRSPGASFPQAHDAPSRGVVQRVVRVGRCRKFQRGNKAELFEERTDQILCVLSVYRVA